MMRGRLAFAVVLLLGCGGSGATGSPTPDTNASVASGKTSLTDDAFARPWVLIDQVKPDHPLDAVVSTPVGFVAITHAPTIDGKGMPARNNIAATSSDGVTWQEHSLGEATHGRALAWGNGIIVLVGQRFGEGPRGFVSAAPTESNGRKR